MAVPALLACDWGTTNLRAWTLDGQGAVLAAREFPLGVSRLSPGEAAAVFADQVRPALDAQNVPAILCGMVGSGLGWTTAPYHDAPTTLPDLARAMIAAPGAPDVRIVPGVRCAGFNGRGDVMRGEETQLFGWLAQHPEHARGRHLVCHPGTHTKWMVVEDGRLTAFATAMTGELFALLTTHGVLATDSTPDDDEAFDEGLSASGDGAALAARLFTARARVVGGFAAPETLASYLSGLLVGADVAATPSLLDDAPASDVVLLGDPQLCARYARALDLRGCGRALTTERGGRGRPLGAARYEDLAMTLAEALDTCPLVAILRGVRPDEVVAHVEVLYEAGIRAVEVPLNSPEPLTSLRRIVAGFEGRMTIGAGTVLAPDRVDAVAEAGGRFIVSPNTDLVVIRRAVEVGLECAPGFATGTEAFAAYGAGARHLKLFPASTYAPTHLRQLKAVLPADVIVWAVGGVGPDNMAEWWAAGARAFGLGGELFRAGQSTIDSSRNAARVMASIQGLTPSASKALGVATHL